MAVLDIIATSLVVYYILKLLRDTRAWQLLKGLAMIIGFTLVCSLLGLTTVGFLLNNTISVFAIAFRRHFPARVAPGPGNGRPQQLFCAVHSSVQ